MNKKLLALVLLAGLSACSDNPSNLASSKQELGEKLYEDTNLSLNRTQSCSTCHNRNHGFIDDRPDAHGLVSAVSVGDDGSSLGDRNAPTAGYARFSPDFHLGTRQRHNKHNSYTGGLGGQFLDGREIDLKGQAGGPPTNPIEMGMPDKASVINRLQENQYYIDSFKHLYGDEIFNDTEAAYDAMAESIGEFEKTDEFSPFDSKYDRSLSGDYILSFKENTGKALFFSQFTNCGICHQLHDNGDPVNKFKETFTSYEYHNIAVPVNETVRLLNGVTEIDPGLENNTGLESDRGKYKVPTLRNVAITGPYMHNGVFRELKTVIEFYDHFVNPTNRANNPETGIAWSEPEVSTTISSAELATADPMTDNQLEAMVCFLRTLTDQRYEHLIVKNGIECSD
ncbi:MAG: cytochrome-c peroxidase [Gammaproteobacteria bacterium]